MADERKRDAATAAALDAVYQTIRERQETLPEGSYVTHLLHGGVDRIARKVGEEALEVVLAAKNETPDELTAEVADLWFHCLVLLAHSGLSPADVYAELARRHGKRPTFQKKAAARAQLPGSQDV